MSFNLWYIQSSHTVPAHKAENKIRDVISRIDEKMRYLHRLADRLNSWPEDRRTLHKPKQLYSNLLPSKALSAIEPCVKYHAIYEYNGIYPSKLKNEATESTFCQPSFVRNLTSNINIS